MKIDSFDNILKWSYNLASKWVQDHLVSKGVNSVRKFDSYKKNGGYLPPHFPKRPDDHFRAKGKWKGWRDFLGNPDNSRGNSFLSYENACRMAQTSGITNSTDYKNWKQRPQNMPSRPEYYYKEWNGWAAFLGCKYLKPNPKRYSKLREADVRIIKHQLSMGVSGAVLARSFGVSEMQISRIKSGENWSELE